MDWDEPPAGLKLIALVLLMMLIDWACWFAWPEPLPPVAPKGKP